MYVYQSRIETAIISENTSGEGYYINDKVFPKWKSKYPSPPDVIGITRIYDPKVDKPVRGWLIQASRLFIIINNNNIHVCMYI